MPGGDRTGPMGQGSGSGRSTGYCGGARAPGFTSAPQGRGFFQGRGGGGFGRGYGAGRGWGRGRPRRWGRWFGAPLPEPPEEAEPSREEADRLKASITSLEERLARLEQRD